jgi:hypothetical protein
LAREGDQSLYIANYLSRRAILVSLEGLSVPCGLSPCPRPEGGDNMLVWLMINWLMIAELSHAL